MCINQISLQSERRKHNNNRNLKKTEQRKQLNNIIFEHKQSVLTSNTPVVSPPDGHLLVMPGRCVLHSLCLSGREQTLSGQCAHSAIVAISQVCLDRFEGRAFVIQH